MPLERFIDGSPIPPEYPGQIQKLINDLLDEQERLGIFDWEIDEYINERNRNVQ